MKRLQGIVGSREADGWVEWETVCDGLSYEPALHCGHFALGISRGEFWGAQDSDHGIMLIDFYDDPPAGSDEWEARFDAVYKDIPQQFLWTREGMVERAVQIAEFMEHPNIYNVREAASELYYALLQEGSQYR